METRQDVRTDVPATLDELIAAARQRMEEAGYTPSTRSRYGEVWSAVKRFALTVEKTDHFSVDLIERYLTHRGYPPGGWPHPMPPRLQQDLSALRLLTEFQVRGRIQPKQCVDRRLSLPAHLLQALTDYEQECICAGNRPATLRTRRQYLLTFLVFLHRAGVEHLSSVRPAQLSDFLLAQHQHCPGAVAPIITALRSFLRQDPNIILVGEIRDFETAEIAIKASLTGHLVLSTLHTNDAPSTISRLMNMGVEPFLVATSVNIICAQRLVRRICAKCKAPDPHQPPVEALAKVGFTEEEVKKGFTVMKGHGCDTCGGRGYKGRVGHYEVLEMSETLKDMILTGASAIELREQAQKEGMITLRRSGCRKVLDGVTTIEEIVRETVL